MLLPCVDIVVQHTAVKPFTASKKNWKIIFKEETEKFQEDKNNYHSRLSYVDNFMFV